ncbi:MAG: hypothetical protein ACP5K5_02140 [Candidatus Micrarchaeia archaeon]
MEKEWEVNYSLEKRELVLMRKDSALMLRVAHKRKSEDMEISVINASNGSAIFIIVDMVQFSINPLLGTIKDNDYIISDEHVHAEIEGDHYVISVDSPFDRDFYPLSSSHMMEILRNGVAIEGYDLIGFDLI